MYAYELFRLTNEDISRLAGTMDAAEYCRIVGQWHIFTAPTEDYANQANEWFRRAIDYGDAEAKLHLANMYRLGDLGKVDMDEYHRLLGEAVDGGCQLAEIRFCKDIFYGVGQRPDKANGLEETRRRLAGQADPDPRWYDTLGWMLLSMDEKDEANKCFLKAIECGYIDSYMGLSDMPERVEEGREAGCGGCCILMAEELEKKYDECSSNDANAVEYFSDDNEKRAYLDANHKYRKELAAQIEALYEEAVSKGEPLGLYYLGMIHYDATLGHLEDDDKAWAYFMRGNQLGEVNCIAMLAEMTEEGRAPDEYGWNDACFFHLKALRYGDNDQLLPVVRAYHEGDLDEYADEIKRDYLPRYDELDYDSDGLEDWPDDDPEDDDGRFDAWA